MALCCCGTGTGTGIPVDECTCLVATFAGVAKHPDAGPSGVGCEYCQECGPINNSWYATGSKQVGYGVWAASICNESSKWQKCGFGGFRIELRESGGTYTLYVVLGLYPSGRYVLWSKSWGGTAEPECVDISGIVCTYVDSNQRSVLDCDFTGSTVTVSTYTPGTDGCPVHGCERKNFACVHVCYGGRVPLGYELNLGASWTGGPENCEHPTSGDCGYPGGTYVTDTVLYPHVCGYTFYDPPLPWLAPMGEDMGYSSSTFWLCQQGGEVGAILVVTMLANYSSEGHGLFFPGVKWVWQTPSMLQCPGTTLDCFFNGQALTLNYIGETIYDPEGFDCRALVISCGEPGRTQNTLCPKQPWMNWCCEIDVTGPVTLKAVFE